MDVLITGGNGFLGHNLTMALQRRGDTVRVIALPTEDTTWLERRGVRVFRGDIRDPTILVEPMRDVDAVFHLAALLGAWRPLDVYRAVNVEGTRNVCQAARAAGARRLVHISSAMVYNLSAGHPVSEDEPLTPLDEPYCISKAEGDRLVQELIARENFPGVIIRPGTLFGPGDRLNFGRIADRLKAGKHIIIGSGDNHVPFVYISDMVQGLLLALDHPNAVGQAFNLGHDQPLTQEGLFTAIAQDLGVAPPRLHVPYWSLYTAAWAAERIADLSKNRVPPFLTRHGVKLYGADNVLSIDKARRMLGYEPQVMLRAGVQRTVDWYLHQEGWSLDAEPASGHARVQTA